MSATMCTALCQFACCIHVQYSHVCVLLMYVYCTALCQFGCCIHVQYSHVQYECYYVHCTALHCSVMDLPGCRINPWDGIMTGASVSRTHSHSWTVSVVRNPCTEYCGTTGLASTVLGLVLGLQSMPCSRRVESRLAGDQLDDHRSGHWCCC
jgi:hypothetical protein